MMSHGFKSSKQDFTFGPWKVTAAKNHIMKSKNIERWDVLEQVATGKLFSNFHFLGTFVKLLAMFNPA